MLGHRGVALVCFQLFALGCHRGVSSTVATTTRTTNPLPDAVTVTRVATLTPITRTPVECPAPRPDAGVGLSVAHQHRPTTITQWVNVASLQHRDNHPPVAAVTTGLLWSIAYYSGAASCHPPTAGDRYEYNFSRDQTPSYALYFPSQGEGANFLPNWQVPLPDGGVAHYDAAMFGPDAGAALCLSACAHLVELEVNDGRGGLGLHFIATQVRVLDDAIAISIPRVLDDLRSRFESNSGQQSRALERSYTSAARGLNPSIPLGPRDDGPIQLMPTWLVEQGVLEVLVWQTGRASGELLGGTETIEPTRCPPGAPCAYRESGTFRIVTEASIHHEVAARYQVDSSGALIDEVLYPAKLQVSSGVSQRRLK